MQAAHPLGQLSALQQMMTELIEPLAESVCRHNDHTSLPPLLWLYGRAVYIETRALRGLIQKETDLTDRVKEIFTPDLLPPDQQWQRLPSKDHLLNWAFELQDDNLTKLANPAGLPAHALLEENRLIHLICQARSIIYEQMLQVLVAQRLTTKEPYQTTTPLTPKVPTADHVGVSQGHYRVGAKQDPAALDNEQPAQMIKLSNFRIDRQPVNNGNYLAFMEADGYQQRAFWSEAGWDWLKAAQNHPFHWRKDNKSHWYGTSLNGPADLLTEDPVMGLSQHEAWAYANWTASLGEDLSGAVLQHEFQWEVAVRSQILKPNGRAWEWCANQFEPYSEYIPDPEPIGSEHELSLSHQVLRGGCLHSQPSLRRITFRHHADTGQQHPFAGIRLVYPPKENDA